MRSGVGAVADFLGPVVAAVLLAALLSVPGWVNGRRADRLRREGKPHATRGVRPYATHGTRVPSGRGTG
jgi:hypothetical protein